MSPEALVWDLSREFPQWVAECTQVGALRSPRYSFNSAKVGFSTLWLLPRAPRATRLPQVPVARGLSDTLPPWVLLGGITSPRCHPSLLAPSFRGLSHKWEETEVPGVCEGVGCTRLPRGYGSAAEQAVSAGDGVGGDVFS